ncbi:putative transcriptional regulator [Microbacterium sp. 1154]|uniref:hypothetical protein n=1 Tax=Microbacterium sp. 1154 TaxID=2817733 RepID=UPI002865EF1A|nr:hypothetical protein [Microbacterium sp. 1154]MDR6691377.1 putative transcriptional regulator [Microbacterium sp. 1154]
MDNGSFDHRVAELVAAAIDETGPSRNAVAKEAGVPYATLDRKLKGIAPFNVSELNRLAQATGRDAGDFIPANVEAAL